VTLPVVWLPEADADLKDAFAWYESIHPDLGQRFAFAVDRAVEVITRHCLQSMGGAIQNGGHSGRVEIETAISPDLQAQCQVADHDKTVAVVPARKKPRTTV
jgi:hypothetical protein